MTAFKEKYSFEKRKNEAERIMKKYYNRIPIIAEIKKKTELPNLDKNKYLVPADITVGQFMYVIRRRLRIDSTKAIFIFMKNHLPVHNQTIAESYNQYKDEDGFLYVTVAAEETFG